MAAQVDSHSDMAQARQTDGLSVIFDRKSPGSSHSRSRSPSVSSSASSNRSGRSDYRGRCRSSSSSSSSTSSRSTSSSRSRSRSHPRCHRQSSRCRCDDHGRYSRYSRRRYRARSRSCSRSLSPDRYYHHRRYYRSRSRSRSRSPAYWSRYRRPVGQFRKFSRFPSRTYRRRSLSRSPARSVSLSLHDKKKLLEVAQANAMQMLGVARLELPESVKPILSEEPEPKSSSPEPMTRWRQGSTKPEVNEPEPDGSSPKMSPKMKIAFSENNLMAKPTVVALSSAKVTPRVDSVESRKPYGHWIPISSGQNSSPRKHT